MIPLTCCEDTTDSNVKVSDHRSTHAVFKNGVRHKYRLIKFDGCVLQGEVACDWIVEKTGVGRIAIELKGSDIDHAAKQVERGLSYLRSNRLDDVRLSALIVCTRYPSVDTTVQRIKQRIRKTYGAPLTVKSDGRNLEFEALL